MEHPKETDMGKQYARVSKMRDAGKSMGGMVAQAPHAEHKYYPSISVPMDSVPECKSCEVGDKYSLLCDVVVDGVNKGKNGNTITFKVVKVGVSKSSA